AVHFELLSWVKCSG
ncbi:hypothetical protein D047_3157B, partial [Vibrio parahaemolyticus VPTS-2010_2]